MKKNIGHKDKLIRVIIGIILLSLLFILQGKVRFVGLIGLLPLITAAVGYCPLYPLVGVDTNKNDR